MGHAKLAVIENQALRSFSVAAMRSFSPPAGKNYWQELQPEWPLWKNRSHVKLL
jgi:hypothetical protein